MFRTLQTLLLSATLLTYTAAQAAPIVLTGLQDIKTSASQCYLGCGNDNYDHSNILDGDFGASGNTGLNAWNSGTWGGWVQVDFGSTYVLDRIELYGGSGLYNPFTLLVSVDGNNFSIVATGGYKVESRLSRSDTIGGTKYGAVYDVADATMSPDRQARYLRYSVGTGSPHWGYLYEVIALGHLPATNPPIDPPPGGTGTPVPAPAPGGETLLMVGFACLAALRYRVQRQDRRRSASAA